jgi:hypothetical protein
MHSMTFNKHHALLHCADDMMTVAMQDCSTKLQPPDREMGKASLFPNVFCQASRECHRQQQSRCQQAAL